MLLQYGLNEMSIVAGVINSVSAEGVLHGSARAPGCASANSPASKWKVFASAPKCWIESRL